MRTILNLTLFSLFTLSTSIFSPVVFADQTVTCKSKNNRHNTCRIETHGYVRLKRQLSRAECIQGRSWDHDRRGIWVDDGCAAEFVVEGRHHTPNHKEHSDAGGAIVAAAGLAILGAIIAGNHDSSDDKYRDDNYYGSRHTSYIQSWMVGEFRGYNERHHADVTMHITGDGRVNARVNGSSFSGYINDGRMYIGNAEFDLAREGYGFVTIQVGDYSNRVHYHRSH